MCSTFHVLISTFRPGPMILKVTFIGSFLVMLLLNLPSEISMIEHKTFKIIGPGRNVEIST
jgi:hypothetical protein